MKVMTVLGTRPEIIRLSRIIGKLDRLCRHVLVHTGQNYDVNLNQIFFEQLGLRQPNYFLEAKGSFGEQIGKILTESERVIMAEKPDKLLVLGDTNSSLSVIVAKRLGIPIYHMEAGNRCYDDRVPEEVNRRIIDHTSDIFMPYTESSRQNLLHEGIPSHRIFVTGNPIYEVIQYYGEKVQESKILSGLHLHPNEYFLVTMHRAENVDIEMRLKKLIKALDQVQKKYHLPVIISTHPHTKSKMEAFKMISRNADVRFMPPFGFFDFLTLEQNTLCAISDSGTVQEECAILGIPNVTIRDSTERPETIECGSNMLSGAEPEQVLLCVETVLDLRGKWVPPAEYLVLNVSDTVLKIVLGYHHNGEY